MLLKSVQDSPVKATTSTEPTEESIKIPPDPTDENLTTTAYTSFHEPLAVPSIQAVEFGVWSFVLFNDAWSQKGHSASNTTVILA